MSSPTEAGAADRGAPLDLAVRAAARAARARGLGAPAALLCLGTGAGLLPERLAGAREIALGELEGTPEPWRDARLWAGALAGAAVWLCEDPLGEPRAGQDEDGAGWRRAFPIWLAAAAGARVLLHASAGSALRGGASFAPGGFALCSDHLNLSGSSPLCGLGESTLGPLFPDLSRLHHDGLRRAALARARALGLTATEAVCACTAGPSIETAAERRFLVQRAGADVVVQGLAAPLLTAAHAGLAVLAIVAIADRGFGPARLSQVVAAAGAAEAALEDLVVALAPDVERAAHALGPDA